MKKVLLLLLLVCIAGSYSLKADYLYTVDGKVYQGKMVAFKFTTTIVFNVYKFNKYHKQLRVPLSRVWKIEFNKPETEGMQSSYETEIEYRKLRRGKRSRTLILNAGQKWKDTGIKIRIGQDIMFSVKGAIYINTREKVAQTGQMPLKWDNRKPLPNQPTGTVIAKVGKRGVPFYVGNDKAPFHMSSKGNLFVGVNDFDFKDNSGQFKVVIYY